MLMIQGVACHEIGCPDAWQTLTECKECGTEFIPETKMQSCCSPCCTAAHFGTFCECEHCQELMSADDCE